jgi:hypothetical protein
MDKNYGVITEQNDLGLGFDFLNEKDQKTYQESLKEKDAEKSNKEN